MSLFPHQSACGNAQIRAANISILFSFILKAKKKKKLLLKAKKKRKDPPPLQKANLSLKMII